MLSEIRTTPPCCRKVHPPIARVLYSRQRRIGPAAPRRSGIGIFDFPGIYDPGIMPDSAGSPCHTAGCRYDFPVPPLCRMGVFMSRYIIVQMHMGFRIAVMDMQVRVPMGMLMGVYQTAVAVFMGVYMLMLVGVL